MMCGGFGGPQHADNDIKELVKSIKPKVEAKANATYNVFEAETFIAQVVAGTNFVVKVKVGDGQYIHVKFFRPLPNNGTECDVTEVLTGKSLNDPL